MAYTRDCSCRPKTKGSLAFSLDQGLTIKDVPDSSSFAARPNVLVRALTWLGGHERAVLFALAGIAAGVWLFAELADQVVDGGTQMLDHKILLSMRRPSDHAPLGPPWLQVAARDITALGGMTVLGIVTVFVTACLALDGRRNMALSVFGSIAGGLILGSILKHFFERPRPDLVPYMVYAASSSFPSGHSMMSAVTYLTLGALLARSHEKKSLKAYFLTAATLLTIAVGVSRVYMGVHWPSDVLAGWTAGSVWALCCWLVARAMQRRGVLERGNGRSVT